MISFNICWMVWLEFGLELDGSRGKSEHQCLEGRKEQHPRHIQGFYTEVQFLSFAQSQLWQGELKEFKYVTAAFREHHKTLGKVFKPLSLQHTGAMCEMIVNKNNGRIRHHLWAVSNSSPDVPWVPLHEVNTQKWQFKGTNSTIWFNRKYFCWRFRRPLTLNFDVRVCLKFKGFLKCVV